MSIFESERSEDEPWLQEHKKHHQSPKESFPDPAPPWAPEKKRKRQRAPQRPLRTNDVQTTCQRCHREAPMESIRAGICIACQVGDFLGPTP